jgi:hypothetical protein
MIISKYYINTRHASAKYSQMVWYYWQAIIKALKTIVFFSIVPSFNPQLLHQLVPLQGGPFSRLQRLDNNACIITNLQLHVAL